MTVLAPWKGATLPTEEQPYSTRQRQSSRLRLHPAWIVVIGICALLLRIVTRTGLSGDAYWQWTAGQWMLNHHAIIRQDLFSYTVRGRPWLDDEWGFQVLLAWLVRTIGTITFWIVPAGACITAVLASIARWRKIGTPWLWIAVLTVIAGGSLALGDAPRPQTLSYLFVAGELLVLQLARRNTRWLATFPPLFLLWANIHGSFLAGLAVLVLELLLALWPISRGRVRISQPLPRRAIATTFAASFVATLINPHGPLLLSYAYRVSTAPQLTGLIQEWQSPNFHSIVMLVLVLMPVVVVITAFALTDAPVEAFDLILWLALLLATLHAQRFLPYLGLAWGGLAARIPVINKDTIRPSFATGPLAVALSIGLLIGPFVAPGTPARGGADGMPVAAVNWLRVHPGRVLSTYLWNDYLIHIRIPVFVDGRTDLYFGTRILQDWVQLEQLTANPDNLLRHWNVRYVLWPTSAPLSIFLSQDPRWKATFRSGPAIVFVRVRPYVVAPS